MLMLIGMCEVESKDRIRNEHMRGNLLVSHIKEKKVSFEMVWGLWALHTEDPRSPYKTYWRVAFSRNWEKGNTIN